MKNIDNKIKELADQQSITPPPMVWDNIEKSLRPKKNNKPIFLLFLGIFVVATSLIWLFASNNNLPDQGQESTNVVSDSDNNNSNSSAYIKSNHTSEKEIEAYIIETAVNSSTDKKRIENKLRNPENPAITTGINKELRNTKFVNSSNFESSKSKPSSINTKIENQREIGLEKENISVLSESLQKIVTISELPLLSTSLDYENELIAPSKIIVCPSFGNDKKISIFLELGGLFGKHSKTINNGSNEELAQLRRGSETAWYTWGAYGNAGINITSNFYAGVGVDWTQSKGKFYSAQDAITQMVITFDPSTGVPIDTSLVTGSLINKGEIKYNSIDIPVFIGFTKHYQTWDFGVELGGVFNLNFATKGKIYNELSEISYLDVETDVYKSKLNFGLKTSLLIRKDIGNGFSVQFKPTFKTYFSEINNVEYALPTKYSVFGVNLGIRRDF